MKVLVKFYFLGIYVTRGEDDTGNHGERGLDGGFVSAVAGDDFIFFAMFSDKEGEKHSKGFDRLDELTVGFEVGGKANVGKRWG